MLPTAQRYGMGVLTFGPLNSGWLSGRADPTAGHRSAGAGAKMFDLTQPGVQAKADAVRELTALAAEAGLPLSHLATAFVRAHPAVTAVLVGPRRPEQLTDLLAAADVELGDDLLDRIDKIVPPGVDVNPGDFYIAPAPRSPTNACAAAEARPPPCPRAPHSVPETAATISISISASGRNSRGTSKVMLVGGVPVRNSFVRRRIRRAC